MATLAAAITLPLVCAARQPAPSPERVPAPPRLDPQVLVIFSDDPSQSWIRELTDGINAARSSGAGAPVWYFEYLDAVRFQHERRTGEFLTAIRDKYRERRLDLVVAVASNAIDFVANARDELWRDVPVLFATYGGNVNRDAHALPRASSVSFEYGFDAAIATATTVFPDTTAVFMTSGASAVERIREREVGDQVRNSGLAFVDLAAPSLASASVKVAHLPEHALLFVGGGQLEPDGRIVPSWQLCETLSGAANRPTLMLGAQFLGCGIVGGLMRDYAKIGAVIGQHAIAAASGGDGASEVVPFEAIAKLAFDERQLARWRIDEARLPPGSTVMFRRPSLWRDYRNELVIVAGGVVVQSMLIVGLLYERRARRRAEVESRHSLSLAAHVDRRSAMTALTGSIAHELSQPLGAILHNAEAAEMLVASNRATAPVLQAILSDIRSEDTRASHIVQRHRAMLEKHEIEKRSVDLHAVVREGLALVAHDAVRRQVQIAIDVPPAPCLIAGDQILLQQVIVNLVLNAMDAMTPVAAAQRRVTVRSTVGRGAVEVAVADRGPGVPADILSKLFEPFVTTKANGIGIGLSIARSTIEALDGTIEARNNPDGGATFRFTLPVIGGA